jgi:hypothetical protein
MPALTLPGALHLSPMRIGAALEGEVDRRIATGQGVRILLCRTGTPALIRESVGTPDQRDGGFIPVGTTLTANNRVSTALSAP